MSDQKLRVSLEKRNLNQITDNTTVSTRKKSHPVAGKAVMFDVLKGGYGKSTLSVNLADRLQKRSNNVLYMDLDPNGHITSLLGYDDVYESIDHDYGYVVSEKGYYGKQSLEPEDMIYETDWGWDFVPSYELMEDFSVVLRNEAQSTTRLSEKFLRPLFEKNKYDYCIMDGGGERSKIADNGFYAGRQAMIPIQPGEESVSALKRTMDRVINPLTEVIDDFSVLAIIPNGLSERIDYQTKDRILLERLNNTPQFKEKLPSFARISDKEFEQIDNGKLRILPGVRMDSALSDALGEGMPVSHYEKKECTQIKYIDELAQIVENGGI